MTLISAKAPLLTEGNLTPEMEALVEKVQRNELRAQDAEARLRILEAEIAIIHKRDELLKLKEEADS